jgi:hypothetical protein
MASLMPLSSVPIMHSPKMMIELCQFYLRLAFPLVIRLCISKREGVRRLFTYLLSSALIAIMGNQDRIENNNASIEMYIFTSNFFRDMHVIDLY